MKLRFLAVVCFVAFGMNALASNYKYEIVKGDPMQTRIYTLDNGLKVYLSVNKEKPRIQTYIAVRTGSRNDPAETTGLAHYLEHLMFKGTQKFGTSNYTKELPYLNDIEARYEKYRTLTDPLQRKQTYHEIDSVSQLAAKYNIPNEYDKLMSSIGAEKSNAYTSNDVTCYTEDIPSNEVENWAKVQSDRFQNMVIRGFHTELEAVYEEFNIGLAQDSRKEWAAFNKLLYPTHPYGTQTTIGTQEHLKNPSITNIKNYFKRYYVPNNVGICMAGDFDPDKVIATIDQYFGSWKKSETLSRPEYAPVTDITTPKDTTVIGLEAENVMMGWKFEGASSLQADTLNVIGEMLNNGKAGLIDLDLCQSMKVMGAYAGYEGLHDYGQFIIEGMPKEGQSLEDVRQLILNEINKLKEGKFSDDLLPSVINNYKLKYYRSLQDNDSRANMFVDAFINDQKWEDAVNSLNRISKMTKAEVVAFSNKYINNNFVCVYKRLGNDSTQKKIDKPAITAIPANRDMSSQFLHDITNSQVEPIQPIFLDFKRDLTFGKTKNNLPIIYKHNDEDGLFTLVYRWDFGNTADKRFAVAADYLDYLGTNKKTAEQFKQALYKIACNFNIMPSDKSITMSISGLNENMPQAVALAEEMMTSAKADQDAYKKYVDLELKARQDGKKNQQSNFMALRTYGSFGTYNRQLNKMSEQELRSTSPQTLVDLIKNLDNYEHSVLYYGPTSETNLAKLIAKEHKTAKTFLPTPASKDYEEQTTPQSEIWIAPYNAKNIYMMMFHNEGKQWNPQEAAVASMFNEYFGGGMNTVVFQELREARGLAYSASAYYNANPLKNHPEYGQTYIISQNDKMMDCIRVFNEILDTIPQSETAFNLAKQGLQKQLSSARTTKFNIINAYFNAKLHGIDYDLNERIYNALPSVTLKDVINFEQQNMAHKSYRYLILGDEKSLDMKALEKIGPIKRLSTNDIFGY